MTISQLSAFRISRLEAQDENITSPAVQQRLCESVTRSMNKIFVYA